MSNDRLEYMISLQEANLQISAQNHVLLQRILTEMDEGEAFNRGVTEKYYSLLCYSGS